MSFEITFLGVSGGPIELNTCGLMLKPADVSYQDILENDTDPLLIIDGGAGGYALAEIIRDAHSVSSRALQLYPDSLSVQEYLDMEPTFPFRDLQGNPFTILKKMFIRLKSVLLTHPHLDHILALVINLAGIPYLKEQRNLTVYGSEFTVNALRTHIFNGVIWPNLVKANLFGLKSVIFEELFDVNNGYYTVTMMELSHGHLHGDTLESIGHYQSLAFLVCNNKTQAKILVFGDFESDLVLGTNRNRKLWERVAPFVKDGTLKAIVLECSSPTVTSDTELYGHLMPPHLFAELETLSSLCILDLCPKPLEGFHLIVTHVKEGEDADPRKRVLHELQELNQKKRVGLRVSMAISGVLIVV